MCYHSQDYCSVGSYCPMNVLGPPFMIAEQMCTLVSMFSGLKAGYILMVFETINCPLE